MASDPFKFWVKGLALGAVNQAELTGAQTYWLGGAPLPVLNSFGLPIPTPPAGSSALPTGLRLARQADEPWFPTFSRRFAPPVVIAPITDTGGISIIW